MFGSLLPMSLFARVLLVLVLAFGGFAGATVAAAMYYVLVPLSARSATDLAAFMDLSARTLMQLPPALREGYRERVFAEFQLRLRPPEEPAPAGLGDWFLPYAVQLRRALAVRGGVATPLASNRMDGERWFWTELTTPQGPVWAGIPRSRIATRPLLGLTVLTLLALALAVLTAALLARHVTRPLIRLSQAAEAVARGQAPAPLPEHGARELAHLARQFNALGRQIAEQLADRTVLLTGISHDLRTPLTRLRLAVEMLTTDNELLRARMTRDIDEMTHQIAQAVELGQTLGAGAREPVALAHLLREVAGERPRLRVQAGPDCEYPVNALALRRILGNLIENALRYSRGPVDLWLDCRPPAPAITVADRGAGIPAAEREAVFRPFYRLEQSRSRATGGAGLGLAVARQLARANGMELRLDPRAGGGTLARVSLGTVAA